MRALLFQSLASHAAGLIRPLGALAVLPWIGLSAPLVWMALAALFLPMIVVATPLAALTTGSVINEVTQGLVLGLVAAAPIWAAVLAGRIGDRGAELPGSPLERLYLAAGLATFGAVGGPFLFARALLQSFAHAPLGSPLVDGNAPLYGLGAIARAAMDLAAPLVAAVLVATVVRALAARVAPRSLVGGGVVLQPVLVLTAALVAATSLIATLIRLHGGHS